MLGLYFFPDQQDKVDDTECSLLFNALHVLTKGNALFSNTLAEFEGLGHCSSNIDLYIGTVQLANVV